MMYDISRIAHKVPSGQTDIVMGNVKPYKELLEEIYKDMKERSEDWSIDRTQQHNAGYWVYRIDKVLHK